MTTQTQIPFPVNPDVTKSTNEVAYPVMETIYQRKSIRAFAPTPVEREKIDSLFEAARWSFSASNDQPWVYMYATPDQTDLWNTLLNTLAEANRIWASHAPLLILSLSRTHSLKTQKPIFYHLHDVGAANMSMNLQAVSMGLQMHPMAGFNKQLAIDTLHIPQEITPVAIFAVGYPGTNTEMLNEFQQTMETRKVDRLPQEGFVANKSF